MAHGRLEQSCSVHGGPAWACAGQDSFQCPIAEEVELGEQVASMCYRLCFDKFKRRR